MRDGRRFETSEATVQNSQTGCIFRAEFPKLLLEKEKGQAIGFDGLRGLR